MKGASLATSETDRLDDLLEYDILDTPPDEALDNIVQLAAVVCKVPAAFIGFIDSDRLWFKSRLGFDIQQKDRKGSFSALTILGNDVFIVSDALHHPMFRDASFVTDGPRIRFYAGVPLRSRRGHAIGTLAIMDQRPGALDEYQRKALKVLGQQVGTLLEKGRVSAGQHKTMGIQRQLLEMLVRDVNSPLGSTGTLLQLMETPDIALDSAPFLTSMAAGHFYKTQSVLKILVEWTRIRHQETGVKPAGIMTRELIRQFIGELYAFPRTHRFSIADDHTALGPVVLPAQEILFTIKCLILWFCEIAEKGAITLDELEISNRRLMAKIQLRSPSLLPKVERKVENLEQIHSCSGPSDFPTSDLYFLLAGDMVQRLGGDLRVRTQAGRVTASFRMMLGKQ
jgi:hypothetical protein